MVARTNHPAPSGTKDEHLGFSKWSVSVVLWVRVGDDEPMQKRGASFRGVRRVVAAVMVCAVVAGCVPASPDSTARSSTPSTAGESGGLTGDPRPNVEGPVYEFDTAGGSADSEGVTVTVPPGATDERLEASFGQPIGAVDTELAVERFGPLVQVDHDANLQQPLRVDWDVSALDALELATIGLARWNPELEVWVPTPEEFTVSDGTLTAEISNFSIWTWVTNTAAWTTQTVGELSGNRAAAPQCSSGKLPAWVNNVVRPDENQDAVPIRTCTEPGSNDMLGVKVVNNRPYTQTLILNEGNITSPSAIEEDFTIAGLVRNAAAAGLATDRQVMIPPTRGTQFSLKRPEEPGPFTRELIAGPSGTGVVVDMLTYVLENIVDSAGIGGFDSQLLNTMVQALYDCGGENILQSRNVARDATAVVKVVDVMAQCASSDGVEVAIQRVLRSQIDKGGKTAARAAKTARVLHQTLGALKVVTTVADFSSYTAELISSAGLSEVKISVFGRGTPGILGAWTPSCRSDDDDSQALYVNLTSQDQFADTNKEYWQFDGWQPAAQTAVEPLTTCTPSHQRAVADNIDTTWGDTTSAAIVSATIRTQAGDDVWVLTTDGFGPLELNQSVPGELRDQFDEGWECFGPQLTSASHGAIEIWTEDGTVNTEITAIILADESASTRSGASIGTSFSALRSMYPDLEGPLNSEWFQGGIYYLPDGAGHDGSLSIIFEIVNDEVVGVSLQHSILLQSLSTVSDRVCGGP